VGTFTASSEVLSLAVGDTTFSYYVNLTGYNGSELRTFVKQH
jgi:hypothetical protein